MGAKNIVFFLGGGVTKIYICQAPESKKSFGQQNYSKHILTDGVYPLLAVPSTEVFLFCFFYLRIYAGFYINFYQIFKIQMSVRRFYSKRTKENLITLYYLLSLDRGEMLGVVPYCICTSRGHNISWSSIRNEKSLIEGFKCCELVVSRGCHV